MLETHLTIENLQHLLYCW